MEREDAFKKIKQLEKDKEELQTELRKLKRKPEGRIGYAIISIGFIMLALAFFYSHNVSAFIGVALTFWGALLLYIKPTRFIRKEILDSTINEYLAYYHKLLNELGYSGTPQHISPRTLWGLRNVVLYIPKTDQTQTPTDEQLSSDEVIIRNSQAIKLTPPGLGLSRLIENELKTNFSTVNLKYLQYNLEKAIVEGLEIAEAFKMESTESTIHIEIKGTVFDNAIQELNEDEKIQYISDPLSSAIACILARSTRRPIIIENIRIESIENTIKIDFRLLELSK